MRIAFTVLALATLCGSAYAEYTDSCGLYAQMLWSAAEDYDSQKSQFESACDSYYGYDKDEESACGAYGYHRNAFKGAQRELEDALRNVALFCGPCDQESHATHQTAQKEIVDLKKDIASRESRLKKLEAENAALRRAARVPGSKPPD